LPSTLKITKIRVNDLKAKAHTTLFGDPHHNHITSILLFYAVIPVYTGWPKKLHTALHSY